MTKEKETYVSPTTDVLELRVEGVVCQSFNDSTQTEFYEGIDGGNL